ncbi:hypothetical protein [Allobranchiibius sp. GilTou73]|uniref:hypothetical protein n=1 Tax=Allobranchiibius sp. GilTou73 TaxID=2904523 RepID=UPI001F3963FE|nr:hypothetical protein [Allobranchiibius sp. GilTou73]UIJ35243.1 hypothetical protein LVQ62_02310 [Allobranchiibius sp. GilTou73]
MVSVEAVELPAAGDEAARVIAFLGSAVPQVRVIAATQTRAITMNAAYDGDDFVMAGGVIGGETVTAMIGPAHELPEELSAMLAALGRATSVPSTPRFVGRPVPVPDALVLVDDVRTGGVEGVLDALRSARLDRVPPWLGDLAHGVSAAFLVLVSDEDRTRLGVHLVGLPCGWGHLQETHDGLSMRPAGLIEVGTQLRDVCLAAAALANSTR